MIPDARTVSCDGQNQSSRSDRLEQEHERIDTSGYRLVRRNWCFRRSVRPGGRFDGEFFDLDWVILTYPINVAFFRILHSTVKTPELAMPIPRNL